jgi:hypothetical protein
MGLSVTNSVVPTNLCVTLALTLPFTASRPMTKLSFWITAAAEGASLQWPRRTRLEK